MLEKAFQDVYTKFKLHFYQNVWVHNRSCVKVAEIAGTGSL